MKTKHYSPLAQQGFSLLELSIVLTIIGLIAGSVIVGQEVLKQAEMRSIVNDVSKYSAAVDMFRQQYDAIPGDMTNATTVWGTASGGCPGGARTTTQTCNGNGNGLLTLSEIAASSPEWWEAWVHLSNARLIEGRFSGITNTAGLTETRIGVNVPKARRTDTGFTLYSLIQTTGTTTYFSGDYRLVLGIGRDGGGTETRFDSFSPGEMMSVENKVDDGRPGTGIVRAYKSANCVSDATAGANQITTTYNLSYSGPACGMMYSIAGDPEYY